jgi:hypothetical protein
LLSLVLINVAGLLSGRYGIEGAGVVATLVVTAPALAIIVGREVTAARSNRGIVRS